MSNALGLIEFALFVLAIVGAAAGVTWIVVRVTPVDKQRKPAGDS